MQCEPLIDYELPNPYGSTTFNNANLYHAEDNMKFLKGVYSGQIPMFSSAYSILANTIEQMYKGVYIELYKMYPKEVKKASEYEFSHSHSYDGMVSKIQRFMPVFSDKEYKKIRKHAAEVSKGYTLSKYNRIYELEDFQADYSRMIRQRELLYRGLNMMKMKYLSQKKENLQEASKDALDEEYPS